MSGWQDSNLRPSGPKPDALTGLRYTPKLEAQKYYNFSDFIIYRIYFDNFSFRTGEKYVISNIRMFFPHSNKFV